LGWHCGLLPAGEQGLARLLNNKIRVIQRPDLRAAGAVARRGALPALHLLS
jgi:hypothetical protein